MGNPTLLKSPDCPYSNHPSRPPHTHYEVWDPFVSLSFTLSSPFLHVLHLPRIFLHLPTACRLPPVDWRGRQQRSRGRAGATRRRPPPPPLTRLPTPPAMQLGDIHLPTSPRCNLTTSTSLRPGIASVTSTSLVAWINSTPIPSPAAQPSAAQRSPPRSKSSHLALLRIYLAREAKMRGSIWCGNDEITSRRPRQTSQVEGGEWGGGLRVTSLPKLLERSFSSFLYYLQMQNELEMFLELLLIRICMSS